MEIEDPEITNRESDDSVSRTKALIIGLMGAPFKGDSSNSKDPSWQNRPHIGLKGGLRVSGVSETGGSSEPQDLKRRLSLLAWIATIGALTCHAKG